MDKTGRNDKCPCGSGKKYKQCCATRQTQAWTGRVMMAVVLVMLLGAVYAGITAVTSDPSSTTGGPGKVWSPEHGHYH
jgi:hypothetical protein